MTLCAMSGRAMSHRWVISVDGACSGRRAACAAVLWIDGKPIAQVSRRLPEVDGYVLAAEIGGVALAAELLAQVERGNHPSAITVETDNPDVPRVIQDGYRPVQFRRIPGHLLGKAMAFCEAHDVTFSVKRRNSTAGLRQADRLAGRSLWSRRR